MSEQEKKNCPEYQAGRAAAEWWQTLSEEQRKQMDIVDAFAYGVLHGWNNHNWIPVEEELPKETGWYLVATPTLNSKIDVALWDGKWRRLVTITHWMPLPAAPRKEATNE